MLAFVFVAVQLASHAHFHITIVQGNAHVPAAPQDALPVGIPPNEDVVMGEEGPNEDVEMGEEEGVVDDMNVDEDYMEVDGPENGEEEAMDVDMDVNDVDMHVDVVEIVDVGFSDIHEQTLLVEFLLLRKDIHRRKRRIEAEESAFLSKGSSAF